MIPGEIKMEFKEGIYEGYGRQGPSTYSDGFVDE
jgi:hypothetical protein